MALPYGETVETCPVRSLAAWRDVVVASKGQEAVDGDALVWWSIRRGGHLPEPGISGASIARVVKRRAVEAGLDRAELMSGHSLRRGMATSASRRGASTTAIARTGRWTAGSQVMAGYIEAGNAHAEGAGRFLGL